MSQILQTPPSTIGNTRLFAVKHGGLCVKPWCVMLLVVLVAGFIPFHAQKGGAAELDAIFNSLCQTGQFSGNVLIAHNGKPIYEKSFGFTDQTTREPLNADTMFLLGSVSKQFTAAGIVKLKLAGKLSYEDELVKYLPELPYPGVTIRKMLNHTSGLPDYLPLMEEHWDKTKYATNPDMIAILARYHPALLFPPGQKYLYSNTGYALLAVIIEKVSGRPFPEFMEDQVFKPLGMTRTTVYTRRARPRVLSNYALGYVLKADTKEMVLPDADPTVKPLLWEDGIYGEDGVNTTATDLLKWDQAVYGRTFLPAPEWAEVLAPGKPAEGNSDYGFGWHILDLESGGKAVYHSGGWPGYIAYNEQHLDRNDTIIILRNLYAPRTRMPISAIRDYLAHYEASGR